MVIAVASVALVVDWEGRSVRCALGSVGPTVIRARDAEDHAAAAIDWTARSLPRREESLDDFASFVRVAAKPIDDHRSTAAYRRHAVGICARRGLDRALAHGAESQREEEQWGR
jgi:CO/xanthine dehydrogenase FAD-binding subunit